MASSVVGLWCLAIFCYFVVRWLGRVWANYRAARRSGFPCRISLVHVTDAFYWVLIPVCTLVNKAVSVESLQEWFPWLSLFRIWQAGHRVFRTVGSDSFFLCAASGNMLVTSDAHLAREALGRPHDFHAPVEMLSLYNAYGPTLAASEGAQWRLYRRISTPYFNERTHRLVWRESLLKMDRVCDRWARARGDGGDAVITDVKGNLTSKLNLRIISKVFYGRELEYDGDDAVRDAVPDGHSMTFSEAINTVLSNLGRIFPIPHKVLAKSPVESHRIAYQAFVEWGKYMGEMRDSAKAGMEKVKQKEDLTFLESIILASEGEPKLQESRPLDEAEVTGNMFFYVMAGYDTTSTTLAFVLLLLALHPQTQKKLQDQLDRTLQSKPASEWDIERDFHNLLNGYVGAVIQETLRLYHPVAWYARKAVCDSTLTDSQGNTHFIPENTTCILDVAALGRNPSYWAGGDEEADSDVAVSALNFDPDHWMNGDVLEREVPPASFPFSTGHRACPGKRFAEVEMCAMTARIFWQFSVELVPDEADRKTAEEHGHGTDWLGARTRAKAADRLVNGLGFGHGIYPKDHMPLKMVPRDSYTD